MTNHFCYGPRGPLVLRPVIFFLWGYVKDRVFVPPLLRDLADQRHGSLQQWRISMHPYWRLCGKNLNVVSMCAVSPVVHMSNVSSCQKKDFFSFPVAINNSINPLNPELNPICYLLALLGAHRFLHFSRIRVKLLTFRRIMSYIYGAPILDVSRSHTTTQHSR